MKPNEFMQGCEAMKLVALDTLRAVLEDHFGTIDMSPLAMDIYEDFCDELEGARMNWQPIETAPKDFVTEFDGWNGSRVPNIIWARPEYSKEYAWCVETYENGYGWVNVEVKGLTHWMPLPEPPKE